MKLEDFLNDSLSGAPRNFGYTFRKAVSVLETLGAPYALVGSVAYSMQVKETYTKDADFLVAPELERVARTAMFKAGFIENPHEPREPYLLHLLDPSTAVAIDLMFGAGDPEESAREMAIRLKLYDVPVPTATPEFMLWMYLLSSEGRHKDRGIEILRRGQVDVAHLVQMMRYAGEGTTELGALKAWVDEARRPRSGWRPRSTRQK